MGGMTVPGWQPPKTNPSDTNAIGTYPGSILQSGQDYDAIMKRLRGVADNPSQQLNALAGQYQQAGNNNYNPATVGKFNPITAAQTTYTRSGEASNAFKNLSDLSQSGGYSDSDIANLRARGISPIRAVYANAMQGVNRQKALQGGYSPNYTAAMTKMSRDLSEETAGATQNVNAGIAENVAKGRLAIAPQYAAAAQQETELMNRIAEENAAAQNRASEFNATGSQQQQEFNANAGNEASRFNIGNKNASLDALTKIYGQQSSDRLEAIKSMTSLYGTTPAMPALYGQQALQAQQLAQQERARKQAGSTALMSAYDKAATSRRQPAFG